MIHAEEEIDKDRRDQPLGPGQSVHGKDGLKSGKPPPPGLRRQCHDQIFLALEVGVEGADGDTGGLSHLGHFEG